MAGTWSSGGNLSTARDGIAGAGTQTAGLSFGGWDGGYSATTEEYSGTTWSSGGDLSTARRYLAGCGTQSAGLSFGGHNSGANYVVTTEEYSGTAWSSGGDLSTAREALAGCGTQSAGLAIGGSSSVFLASTEEYSGTAWSSGGDLSTARNRNAGCGTQTAGLSFGGYNIVNVTEEYNGTAWSSGGDLSTAREYLAGAGTQTAGLSFGGWTGSVSVTTEEYSGTAWSSGGDLATARYRLGGAGSQTAGLSFGGNTGISLSAVTEEYNIGVATSSSTTSSSTTSSSTTSSTASSTSSTASSTSTSSTASTTSSTASSTSTSTSTSTSSSSSTTTTTVYHERVEQDVEELYDIPLGDLPANYVVEYYRDKAIAQTDIIEWYGNKALSYVEINELYENQIKIENNVILPYILMSNPKSAVNESYTVCGTTVYTDINEVYNVNDKDPAITSIMEFYSLLSGVTEVQNYDISVTVDDIIVQINDIEITGSIDSYCLSLTMNVAEATDYILCSYGKIAIVTIDSEIFKFYLEGQSKTKQSGSTIYTITGLSLICQLDKPVAQPILKVWDSEITAKAVVEELASDYIDAATYPGWWEGVDWTIPANILYANNESPLDIIKKIVKTSGGIVQTYPDGSLRIRKRYPVTIPLWDTTNADVTLSDEADFFSMTEAFDLKNGVDKVLVSNQSVSDSNQVQIEAITIDAQTKQLKCYQQPYLGNFDLHTSGGNWVSIEKTGETEETLTELIEIVAGAGNVSRPIYEEITADREYKQTQLGAVTFSENGQLTTEITGQSLLSITYKTKYKLYTVKSPNIESVQFWTEAT